MHSCWVFNIGGGSITDIAANGFSPVIICSCNVISDHDIRAAVMAADALPRTPSQVYGCLGCSVECGRCARSIKRIIDEALGACAVACRSGCPHRRAEPRQHDKRELIETEA